MIWSQRRLFSRKLDLLFIVVVAGTGLPTGAQTIEVKQEEMRRQTLTVSPPTSQPPLDLATAVKKALANNHAIQVAKDKIDQDRFDTSTVRSALFPNLNLMAKAGEYKDGAGPARGATSPDSYSRYNADVTLSQPVFAFGSIAAIHVADYTRRMNELDLEIAERTLTLNVIQAYYQVLLNRRLLTIRERIQKVLEETLTTAQKRLRTGRGQLLDVLQAKTQIALLKPQIEDAHNQLESAAAQLATYMAEEGKYELQVVGELKGLHVKDVQRRLNMKENRLPELERIRLIREQLDEQRQVVEGKHLPSLFLNGDYGATKFNTGNMFTNRANDWSVYLAVTIPIFSGFQSIYERESLSAQDRQIAGQVRDLEDTLSLNQVTSLKSLQSTGASLESAEEAADLADQSMKEANRNFRLATIDFLQFLQVQQSALQADSSLDTIKFNNIVALTNYFVATGQPLSVLVDLLQEKRK